MKKFILILTLISLFFGASVFAKRKKSSRHRRAGVKYTKVKSSRFNVDSVTTGLNLNVNKITKEKTEQNTSMTCGVPADVNNNLAKRKCALVIAEGLKKFCTSFYGGNSGYNDCSSKIKVQFKFNMGLPQLEDIKETIGDKECRGEELQKFCSNFEEDLINGLWDMFSKPVIRKRKYCNFAKAKFYVAQECFRYIQTNKNNFAGGIDAFKRDYKTSMDEEIEARCGLDAIKKAYKNIAVDKFEDGDVSEFINTNKAKFESLKLNVETYTDKTNWNISKTAKLDKRDNKTWTPGIGHMKNHFTSDVAKIFANLGDNSYNIMGQLGKFIELKLTTKSASYPRELVTIANTFIIEGENACGQDFKTAMEDTSFKLADNRSALEKYIEEKGIIKGTYDYLIDNTVGVFSTDKADEIKKRGWKLPPKTFDPGDSNKEMDKIKGELTKLIGTCPINKDEKTITEFNTQVKKYLNDMESTYKTFKKRADKFKPRKDGEKDFENIQLAFYKKVAETLNIINSDKINKFKQAEPPAKQMTKVKDNNVLKELNEKTIDELKKYIELSIKKLNEVTYFTCPDVTEKDMNEIFKDPPKEILFTLKDQLENRQGLENYIEAFKKSIEAFKTKCTGKCPADNPLIKINLDEPKPPK